MSEFQIKKFAEKLKKIAKQQFGGNKHLAQKLGEAPSWLSNYTSGAREPGASILKRFYEAGIDINALLSEDESTIVNEKKIEYTVTKTFRSFGPESHKKTLCRI